MLSWYNFELERNKRDKNKCARNVPHIHVYTPTLQERCIGLTIYTFNLEKEHIWGCVMPFAFEFDMFEPIENNT